jgi:hypothetical protein
MSGLLTIDMTTIQLRNLGRKYNIDNWFAPVGYVPIWEVGGPHMPFVVIGSYDIVFAAHAILSTDDKFRCLMCGHKLLTGRRKRITSKLMRSLARVHPAATSSRARAHYQEALVEHEAALKLCPLRDYLLVHMDCIPICTRILSNKLLYSDLSGHEVALHMQEASKLKLAITNVIQQGLKDELIVFGMSGDT